MKKHRVLVIEDDQDVARVVALYLRADGTEPLLASTIREAREALSSEELDAVLLDVGLPDGDGMVFCSEIRKTRDVPILLLTSRRTMTDVVNGLDMGADDYITKPFEPEVLLARLRACLRRTSGGRAPDSGEKRTFGDLRIDFRSLDVFYQGSPVDLHPKERQLLLYLASHPGQVFSVGHLYEQLWGWERTSDERTVMVHIRYLRRKLNEDAAKPKYIATVRGFGYKFVGEEEYPGRVND